MCIICVWDQFTKNKLKQTDIIIEVVVWLFTWCQWFSLINCFKLRNGEIFEVQVTSFFMHLWSVFVESHMNSCSLQSMSNSQHAKNKELGSCFRALLSVLVIDDSSQSTSANNVCVHGSEFPHRCTQTPIGFVFVWVVPNTSFSMYAMGVNGHPPHFSPTWRAYRHTALWGSDAAV